MQHKTTVVVTTHDDMQVIYPPGADFVVIRVRYGAAKEEHSGLDAGLFELVVHVAVAEKVFDKAHKLASERPQIEVVEPSIIIPGA